MTQKSPTRTHAAPAPKTRRPDASKESALASPKMLKLPEVLAEIDMSRAAFYRMRARGQAPRLRKLPNGQLRVSRADLDAWWESCGQSAA